MTVPEIGLLDTTDATPDQLNQERDRILAEAAEAKVIADEKILRLEVEVTELKQEQDFDKAITVGRGNATKAFLEQAPEVVKEITHQIVMNRDQRVREHLRKQLRGMFDVIFADTKHSQSPISKKRRDTRSGEDELNCV